MAKTKNKETVSPAPGGKSPALTKASPKTVVAPEMGGNPVRLPSAASGRFPALEEQEITFSIFAPHAREVKVAGNFNNWNPEAAPLKSRGQGEWAASLKLPTGRYEYRFVVDGQWTADPKTAQKLPNPFGGFNSVLTVPSPERTPLL